MVDVITGEISYKGYSEIYTYSILNGIFGVIREMKGKSLETWLDVQESEYFGETLNGQFFQMTGSDTNIGGSFCGCC